MNLHHFPNFGWDYKCYLALALLSVLQVMSVTFQFDFPFIEVIRVKEVKFRLRLPIGFNYKDYNFSEIDYEIGRQKQIDASQKTDDILEINDLSDSENEENNPAIPDTAVNNKVQSKSSPRNKYNGKPAPFLKSKSVQHIEKKKLKRTNTETSISTLDDDNTDDSDSDCDSPDSEEIVVSLQVVWESL